MVNGLSFFFLSYTPFYAGFPAGWKIGKKSGILFRVWEKSGEKEICPLNMCKL